MRYGGGRDKSKICVMSLMEVMSPYNREIIIKKYFNSSLRFLIVFSLSFVVSVAKSLGRGYSWLVERMSFKETIHTSLVQLGFDPHHG